MKNDLKKLVDQILPELLADFGASSAEMKDLRFDIELPKVRAHGDLAINLAFQLSRALKRSPLEIADQCVKKLEREREKRKSELSWIREIAVAQPGFINFRFSAAYFARQLLEIHRLNERFGESNAGGGRKALIEFVSANPTGPLTIAHGRQAAVGDALARILKTVGWNVHKEFYLNDCGRQVRLLGESLWARYQEQFGLPAVVPEEGYRGGYLADLAGKLKEEKGGRFLKEDRQKTLAYMTEYAVSAMLGRLRGDLGNMRVEFDEYFSESILYKKKLIDRALEDLRKHGCLFEADGALWFRSSALGDDKDRVLVKQTKEYTYLAPDIAYHEHKFRRGYEVLINLWGPDHHGYVPRMRAACEALGYDPHKLKILIVQLTTLYRGGEPVRMSTRQGEFVTLKELMDEVGVDAARFFFLMRKAGSHLDFDLELAKKTSDENPVYYVQYAHARISSILAFAKRKVKTDVDLGLICEEETLELIKKMLEFPEALRESAERLEPYRMTEYAVELAAAFHKFYTLYRVVTDDEQLTEARLLVIDCVRIVLRNTLSVLGMTAPVTM